MSAGRATSIAVLAVSAVTLATAPAHAAEPTVRKSVTQLSAKERQEYVQALLELKRTPSPWNPKLSYYDQLVTWHVELGRCSPFDPLLERTQNGHAGPVFMPWHRQFLLMLEKGLRQVSGKRIGVPYWDYHDRTTLPYVFRDDFMGGNGDPADDYAVKSGPFRKGAWRLNVKHRGHVYELSSTSYLTRNMGSPENLPPRADQELALHARHFDAPPFDDTVDPAESFRNAVEGSRAAVPVSLWACAPDGWVGFVPNGTFTHHAAAHIWVGGFRVFPLIGGTLTINSASPNDPVFFLLHSYLDREWAEWQARHPNERYRGYPRNDADDELRSFREDGIHVTPRQLDDIRALGYRYAAPSGQRRPTRCRLTRRRLRPLQLSVSPRRVRAGRHTAFRFRVTACSRGRRRPVRGATVRFAGRRMRTNRAGRASTALHLRRAGVRRVHAAKRGFAAAGARVRVLPARRAAARHH